MPIKAIETTYDGVRFRSRQEARWAVLFNLLGIRWQYEYEGFELSDEWYVPDFWLPQIECFAEIKGAFNKWTHTALRKATDLALTTSKSVLLCDDISSYPLIRGLHPHAGIADFYDVDLVRSLLKRHVWTEVDGDFDIESLEQWEPAAEQARKTRFYR